MAYRRSSLARLKPRSCTARSIRNEVKLFLLVTILAFPIGSSSSDVATAYVPTRCREGFDKIQRANFLQWNFSAGCSFLSPRNPPVMMWSADLDPIFNYYRGLQVAWLVKLTAHLHLSGFVFFIAADNATYPAALATEMYRAGMPLLSHSHKLPVGKDVVLTPDFHFIESGGFRDLIFHLHAIGSPWQARSKMVFWRGSTTGSPPCVESERVRACQLVSQLGWCDVKISQLVQGCNLSPDDVILAAPANETSWITHRGVLDIDGNVNAWGLFWRLASKSVVFRVESEYVNRYILATKPWVHYVPILKNLSDLVEKTQLITSQRATDTLLLSGVQQRALMLTRRFTYDKQTKMVASDLHDCWNKYGKRHENVTSG